MLENTGYKEVEDKEETFEADDSLGLAEIRGVYRWRRNSLLETEYDLFQGWLVENRMMWVYNCFVRYLVDKRAAGEY